MSLRGIKIGFGMSGSFCTFSKAFAQAKRLAELGAELTPVMSFNAASLDTRFGSAAENVARIEEICGRKAILTIAEAEPIGPKKMFDLLLICPCTATTMAKLAGGIYDTPITLAAKSHLRGEKPVLLAASTNDALSASGKNIGALMNLRHYYFVPMGQDDFAAKPSSLSADFDKVPEAAEAALSGRQLQPILL
jgi:dipicolinate synthase subunit B